MDELNLIKQEFLKNGNQTGLITMLDGSFKIKLNLIRKYKINTKEGEEIIVQSNPSITVEFIQTNKPHISYKNKEFLKMYKEKLISTHQKVIFVPLFI